MSETTFVDVEPDVRIAVERWPALTADAPTVLAIHGFSSNALIFAGLAEALNGSVELIAYDCRGRARSSHPEDPTRYGMRRHAEDAAAVLRALGRSSVILVGTSMGAWISTQLAAHHRDLVRGVVLVDGGYLAPLSPDADPVEHVNDILLGGLDRLDLELPSVEFVVEATKASPGLGSLWDANVEASVLAGIERTPNGVRAKFRRYAAAADAKSYYDPMDKPKIVEDLALITCPVHLLTAPVGFPIDADNVSAALMPPSSIEAIGKAIPQLTHEEVPGTHHFTICAGKLSNPAVVRGIDTVLARSH